MFRIVAEKPPSIGAAQANQLVEQWLATHTPWADDPTPHEITFVDDSLTDVPQHFRCVLRFERDSSMTTIREQIETDLAGVMSWYQIDYHECANDENEASTCLWESVTDYGDVPAAFSTFE
jgi:head-tail adaptor